jgi:uncharacterized membrane protein (UPF0127 family)
MNLKSININGADFKVSIADTPELQTKGLSNLNKLGKNRGMLFIFPEPVKMYMIMKDMNFDLDFIFLNKDWQIVSLASLSKDSKSGVFPSTPCHMVLEVNKGVIKELNLNRGITLNPSDDLKIHFDGVKKFQSGGRFEIIGDKIYKIKVEDIKPEEGKLQLLNTNGEVVANILPGARIFSREHTKELINKYKKGDKLDLGRFIITVLDIHDNQGYQYVKN